MYPEIIIRFCILTLM